MKLTKRHHAFAGFILLALGLMGMSALLLLKSETQRRETRFAEYVQNISGIVRNQLDTNEAVLAGFSAFLQAVDQSDNEAAARYAAAVMSAYPHLYMLEAARGAPGRAVGLRSNAASHLATRFHAQGFPHPYPATGTAPGLFARDLAGVVHVSGACAGQCDLRRQAGNRRLSVIRAGPHLQQSQASGITGVHHVRGRRCVHPDAIGQPA
jgi:hypothetical protein